MPDSRRQLLRKTPLGLLGAAVSLTGEAQEPPELPPGAPPAFGTGPAVGPEVSPSTFAEAEKLVQVQMTAAQRAMAASSWRKTMAAIYERRTGPRKIALEANLAPASRWNPLLPGLQDGPAHDRFIRSTT